MGYFLLNAKDPAPSISCQDRI